MFQIGDYVEVIACVRRDPELIYCHEDFKSNAFFHHRGIVQRIKENPHVKDVLWYYLIIGEVIPPCIFLSYQLELLERPSIEELLTSKYRSVRRFAHSFVRGDNHECKHASNCFNSDRISEVGSSF